MKTRGERIKHIKDHPQQHMHNDMYELQRCCMVDGALDLMMMEIHPAIGYNGGQKCDVREGPCSCGAWH